LIVVKVIGFDFSELYDVTQHAAKRREYNIYGGRYVNSNNRCPARPQKRPTENHDLTTSQNEFRNDGTEEPTTTYLIACPGSRA
jgi:hypothetical protein